MTFSVSKLDTALREALKNDLLAIADTKLVLGNWYAVCVMNGRSLPDFAALTAMSSTTYGQARALYQYLVNFGLDYAWLERGRGAGQIHSMDLLDSPPRSWADFLAAIYLVEEATWALASGFLDHPDRVLSGTVEKMGQEAYFHAKYVSGWARVLAGDASERAAFVAAFRSRYRAALRWFGPETAPDPLADAGMRKVPVAKLRQGFAAECQKLCDRLGVTLDLPAASPVEAAWRTEARRTGSLPPRLFEVVRFKDAEAAH